MNSSGKLGAAIIVLFGLPFAAFGLYALKMAIQYAIEGSPPGQQPFWYPLIFGIVFSGIGFGLMFAAVMGNKFLAKQHKLEAEHPNEPWLWREDWAKGRVQSGTRGNMIGAWVFAIIWSLASSPALFLAPREAAKKPAVWIALIFPLVGLFLLIRAIRQTIAYVEFGKTYFEMASVPGVIGGELNGVVQARFPHSPDHGILLRLTCIHRTTTGSGDSQSTNEQILWRDERKLSPAEICPGPTGTSFPISFRIPWDAQPTEKRNPHDEFVWLLEALADVPGVNYHDIFEVPVFRTSQTPAHPEREAVFSQPTPARPEVMTVKVEQNASGTEFFFGAARNKSTAVSSTIFLAVLVLLTVFLANVQIPKIFAYGCGLFSLLAFFIALNLWFATTRVVMGNGTLSLQSGLLGGGKIEQIPYSDIASIALKIQTQQGGATGTPFYDIELTKQNGRRRTLGRLLRDKSEAEWLVSEMRRLAGLQTKAAGASS